MTNNFGSFGSFVTLKGSQLPGAQPQNKQTLNAQVTKDIRAHVYVIAL